MKSFEKWSREKSRHMFCKVERDSFSNKSDKVAKNIWMDQEDGLAFLEKSIIIPIKVLDDADKEVQKTYDWIESGSFSVPLSVNGKEPATHYGCHWYISPRNWKEIEKIGKMVGVTVHDGNWERALDLAGLKRVEIENGLFLHQV